MEIKLFPFKWLRWASLQQTAVHFEPNEESDISLAIIAAQHMMQYEEVNQMLLSASTIIVLQVVWGPCHVRT